ncbi:hypothetical protein F0562_031316 [Nyssa sinensis]|uniref:Uncharacterized protein n=1 Tax=Nyssa sinensis TaxID=561372 RepID=A0A5J5ATT6_9ASTE|nr:hypothetical protein F0562_031316 [Nyssa sinensis]
MEGTSFLDMPLKHWESDGANKMVEYTKDFVSKSKAERFSILGNCILQFADDFTCADPIDGSTASKQAVWFVFTDGLRIISRLSGSIYCWGSSNQIMS